jgi:hypothetical protein
MKALEEPYPASDQQTLSVEEPADFAIVSIFEQSVFLLGVIALIISEAVKDNFCHKAASAIRECFAVI